MALKTLASVWIAKPGSKAAYTGYMEGPNRTKGPKVLIFRNEKATPENRQPQYRICVESDEAEPEPQRSSPPDHFSGSDEDVPF